MRKRGDLRLGELVLRRHFEIAGVADGRDEQALLRLTGDEGGTGDAALQDALAGVEAEVGFLLVSRVAFETGIDEDGADFAFEIVVVGGFFGVGCWREAQCEQHEKPKLGASGRSQHGWRGERFWFNAEAQSREGAER